MSHEQFFRMLLYLPLAFITIQVMMLRRILFSRAWTMITSGFLTFAVMVGVNLFASPHWIIRLGCAFLGYVFLGAGFHRMRKDLDRIRKKLPINEIQRDCL